MSVDEAGDDDSIVAVDDESVLGGSYEKIAGFANSSYRVPPNENGAIAYHVSGLVDCDGSGVCVNSFG